MKNMKKFTSIALAATMALSLTIPAMAAEKNLTVSGIDNDNTAPTLAEIVTQIRIDRELRSEAATRSIADRITYTAPTTERQQKNKYYCGPACTQMVYEGITGDTSHDQDWFAKKLGTTTAGSSSANIASTLKSLTGKNYSVATISASNQDQMDLYNNISKSLSKGCAVVAGVADIPDRGYSTDGHFIVIHGSFIDMAYGASTVYYTYTDPHYNDKYYGVYTISGSGMYTALTNNMGKYSRVA